MKKAIFLTPVVLIFIAVNCLAGNLETRSENGSFILRLEMNQRPLTTGKLVTATIALYEGHSKTKVAGAQIEVVPWMTVHGHGSSKKTVVKEKGEGLYSVENIYFTMDGDWDILINVRKERIEDKAILTLTVIK